MKWAIRILLTGTLLAVAICAGSFGWTLWSKYSLEKECVELEKSGRWARLLRSAELWVEFDPRSRTARQAGVKAGRVLRDVEAVNRFLDGYPCELAEDVHWVSMLADLKFGPLNDPMAGAEMCHRILRIDPQHISSHQRLVFFYAMSHQQAEMQLQIREAMRSGCQLPEIFAYGFLGSGLRLRNGIAVTEPWLRANPQSERLIVARAIHFAQSLMGAVPITDEAAASQVRARQAELDSKMQELLKAHPKNRELMAFRIEQSMERGVAEEVGRLLSGCPVEADGDFRFWHARGWLFARIQDYPEAERCYQRALTLNPLDWRTHFHRSESLRLSGQQDECAEVGELAARGRQIERDILEQPDMKTIPKEIYGRLAVYADGCGDTLFATQLRQYLELNSGEEKPSSAEPRTGAGQ